MNRREIVLGAMAVASLPPMAMAAHLQPAVTIPVEYLDIIAANGLVAHKITNEGVLVMCLASDDRLAFASSYQQSPKDDFLESFAIHVKIMASKLPEALAAL